MDRKEIEKLRRIAIDVADGHGHDGVCGFHPGFKFSPCRHTPQVHLRYEEFCNTFDKCEKVNHDETNDEVFVMVDGVKFYALVNREEKNNAETY